MQKIDIEKSGYEFKNLVSGPAPIGRILNYIWLSGQGKLKHKNGYRYTDLKNNIGYAWTTEFMIGLGLVHLGDEVGDATKLDLTTYGKELYDLISTNPCEFEEGTNTNSIEKVKREINNCNKDLYETFKRIFMCSVPFQVLRDFLLENGFHYGSRNGFMDDYFVKVCNMYNNGNNYNYNAKTTTAQNRVPSIIQLCILFDLVVDEITLDFKKQEITKILDIKESEEYPEIQLIENAISENELVIDADELAKKYGIDGNVVVSAVVRNSNLQTMFKHNLMIEQNHCCVMCGIKNKELLIASHIKPASKCDSFQKADKNNGLLLCGNHDKLFDRLLITFDCNNGKIKISKCLSDDDKKKLLLKDDMCLPDALLTNERKAYLEEHNKEFENIEATR